MSSTKQGGWPRGCYRDRLLFSDGEVIVWEWRSNLVVDTARLLIAGFMRGDGPSGIQRLLIGRGQAEWDLGSTPQPVRSNHELIDPSPFEIVLTSNEIKYLDAAGNPTPGPTPRLRVVVTLGAGEPPGDDPYPLREFGLFGSFGGDAYMINYVRHGVIQKPGDATLERTIQLVF